jgi:GT2 family glycosyltransferase
MAHGDIVMFIDSDVTPYPDYVEKVLNVFKKYPRALGVGSWVSSVPRRPPPMGIRYFTNQTLLKLFYLGVEYPIVLSRTIYCRWLLGTSMSFRRSVFSEFQFDENLKGYTWGEDFLFSSSISERYRESLLLTPDAVCIHNWSGEARPEGKDFFEMQMRNDKYVLTKLWGFKGLTMFGRKYLGLWFFRVIRRLKSKLSL